MPEIRVYQTPEMLSRAAAQLFIDQAAQAIRERGQFLVALNGGSTPIRLFQLLAGDYREKMDWGKTQVFWGDERCVPIDDKESSYGQARDVLLSHVSIPDANIQRVNTELQPDAASKDYAKILRRFAQPPLNWPRFDLVLLGMGADGHTASLFPGSPIDAHEPTLAITAQYQDRPANRVTMTPLVFNSAHLVIFMATGGDKAVTLSRVLSDIYVPEELPAQRIRPTGGELIWLVDEDAARKLPRKIKGLKICEG